MPILPTLHHPQIGVFDLRKQGLLGDLIAHLFTSLTKTLDSSGVLIIPEQRIRQTCCCYQKKAVPIPVVLLDLLFIHLIHLEATLPITLSHVSLHIGSGLASFICFVGIEGVSVAIVPPRILILLIVGVNLGLVDNEIPRISSSSLFLEFSIILKNKIVSESLILRLIPLHRSHLPHLGLRPRALVHQRHPPPPPKDKGLTTSRDERKITCTKKFKLSHLFRLVPPHLLPPAVASIAVTSFTIAHLEATLVSARS